MSVRWLVVAIGLDLCWAALPALAATTQAVTYQIYGTAGNTSGSMPAFAGDLQSTSNPKQGIAIQDSASVDYAGGSVSGEIAGTAIPGRLGVSGNAIANASAYQTNGTIETTVTAKLTDVWTFHSSKSTPLHVNASFTLSGEMTAAANGIHTAGGFGDYVTASAQSFLYVSGNGVPINGPYGGTAFAHYENDVGVNPPDTQIQQPAPAVVNVSLVVTPNQPVNISYVLTLDMTSTVGSNDFVAGGSAYATGDFSHTLLWQGISGVTDNGGTPVTDWTLTTDSGFDYTQAATDVPEPGLLSAAAAIPLVFRRHRRRA